MQPKLKIKGQPIDFELCELLGDKPSDFLVLCFDGVQFESFGTPYDTPRNRATRQYVVDVLNDRDDESWREMWENWKPLICKQFGLAETTEAKDYRPLVSYQISRVCPGYSEHLHVAIGLFETIADKIEQWSITHDLDCRVTIINKRYQTFMNLGQKIPKVIAATVLELLKAEQANAPAHRPAREEPKP